MSEEIVVLVTCSAADGYKIAKPLVEEGLAACVNIVPGLTSVFRWQGKVSEETESLLIIKTNRSLWKDLQNRLRELHSYDTPEMLSFAVQDGYPPYLDWLNESLRK